MEFDVCRMDEATGDYVACLKNGETIKMTPESTVFGYVLSGYAHLPFFNGHKTVTQGEYFSFYNKNDSVLKVNGKVFFIIRFNWRGHSVVGVADLEGPGHVRYIDNCTDSLIIAPPKKGDPCLNLLYFPPGVDQTFHTHPSFRAGAVIMGDGVASVQGKEHPLVTGLTFYLPTNEMHRFRTKKNSSMVVLAYHPDTDWGPTDEEHPMINRTVIPPIVPLIF